MPVQVVKRRGDSGYDVWVGSGWQWIRDAVTAYAIADKIESIERNGGTVTTNRYWGMEVDGQYIGALKKLIGK